MKKEHVGPKILLVDIETKPMLAHVWDIWDQNIPLNMIEEDWSILSWSAKWLHEGPDKIMYMDQRKSKNLMKDKTILKGIWKLLDEADVIITQNGKSFDEPKLRARFILNGMKPPSSYKHVDIKRIAKKFAFTSKKLEYMTDKLNKKYKKLKHSKFPGISLWLECMAGNLEAWKEMETYNKYDVLSLEELYHKLAPWDTTVNYDVFYEEHVCTCGHKKFKKNGYKYTSTGKYQRYVCKKCGKESRGSVNLLSKEAKKVIHR